VASGKTFSAKSPGLKLAGNSFGLLDGDSGFGSLNNLQAGDIDVPNISLSLQNSYVVFVERNELLSWAKQGAEIECEVLVIIPTASMGALQFDDILEKASRNLISARESIKKLDDTSSALSKDKSGVRVPAALMNYLQRLASTLKNFTSIKPKSDKPEKKLRISKAKKSKAAVEQPTPVTKPYDPFDQN
jgi:hypothetical protein